MLLPPSVVTVTVRLRNGRPATVHTAPYPAEGPAKFDEDTWAFMYAHFVFVWTRKSPYLRIGHGTLTSAILLWDNIPAPTPWSPESLTAFAHHWTTTHLSKFTR